MFQNTLALIPARAGSKSIALKNIQNFQGIPLLAHSIKTAIELELGFTLVSTESRLIADMSVYHGASVPFLRPIDLAQDYVRDKEVILDAVNGLKEREIFDAEFVLLLRPTYPKRLTSTIREYLSDFFSENEFCMGRSLSLANETPYKMWSMTETGLLTPIKGTVKDDYHNSPRQLLPAVYWQDGNFDILRVSCLLDECNHQIPSSIRGYLSPESTAGDIDYQEQFIEFDHGDNSSKNRYFGASQEKRVSS